MNIVSAVLIQTEQASAAVPIDGICPELHARDF